MRYRLIAMLMLLCSPAVAPAQINVDIGLPGINIGINLYDYPEMVPVPGYPVYYSPRMDTNYFFYDGMYWVYQNDDWYASSWYNGPWGRVYPEYVPLYVLRIPVRYYRQPPQYFRGWQRDEPPRWGEHWGRDWDQRRSGWDRWDRRSAPSPAPLPVYQRNYSGNRYPRGEQQREIHDRNYQYKPRDPVVRDYYEQRKGRGAPAAAERGKQAESPQQGQRAETNQRPQQSPQTQQGGRDATRPEPQEQKRETQNRAAPAERTKQTEPEQKNQRQEAPSRPQQSQPPQQNGRDAARSQSSQEREKSSQGRDSSRESERGKGQDREREKNDERGQERNR